ncbi:hypothetical protein EBZ80_05410 [bacterium]|nr:hypothetical protein [bacterium]
MIIDDPVTAVSSGILMTTTATKTQCQYCSGMYKHINRHKCRVFRPIPVATTATAVENNDAERILLLQIELKKLELQNQDFEKEKRKIEMEAEERRILEEREKRKIEREAEERRILEEREKRKIEMLLKEKRRKEEREAEDKRRREENEKRRAVMEKEEQRRRERMEKEEKRYRDRVEREEKEWRARVEAEEKKLQETIRRREIETEEAIRRREAEDRRHAEMLRHEAEQNAAKMRHEAEQNAIKISAMMSLHHQETETIRSYHDRMFSHLREANNRPRNLSLGTTHAYAPDELRVYGTHGSPWFRADELTAFAGSHAFPRSFSLMGMAGQVIASMAFKGSGDLSPETDFVRVEDWSDFSGEMERVAGVENRDIDRHLDRLCASLPYAEDAGYRPYAPADPSPEPSPQVLASPFFRLEGGDRAAIHENGMTTEDRQGEYGTSLSSFRLVRHKRDEFLERLRVVRSSMSVADQDDLRRTLAFNRARLHLIRKRLENNAAYLPDAMDRYLQDQRFQSINGRIDPSKRRFNPGEKRHIFHNVFFPNRDDAWACRSCQRHITPETYEIGHIVPSKCGNVGSDGIHNVMPLCHGCNHKMASLDAELWIKQQRPSR